MGKKPINFKDEASYKKWLAYGHIHDVFEKSPGNTPVKIGGKPKKVNHKRG